MLKSKKIRTCLLLLSLWPFSGCGEPPTIHVDGKVPPTFHFTGSHFAEHKHLHFFIVSEVGVANQNRPSDERESNADKTIWQIWPDSWEQGELENLPVITYGQVPKGWTQKIPLQGAPSAFVDGRVYEAGGPPVDSRKALMRFTIRAGVIVSLPLYRDEFKIQRTSNP
jgi:hypothetical protein